MIGHIVDHITGVIIGTFVVLCGIVSMVIAATNLKTKERRISIFWFLSGVLFFLVASLVFCCEFKFFFKK
jgi:uncharacterized membrane protein HdeD (DUF308 family)